MTRTRSVKRSNRSSDSGSKSSSSDRLLDAALDSVNRLNAYLAGDEDLTPEQIEAHKGIVQVASDHSFYFFSKAVLGFDLLVPDPHRRWCDDLQMKFWERDFLMRLKPRGTFKTTIYGEALILWGWACISKEIRFFYTSANGTLLDEVSEHLDYYLATDSTSLYAFVFGITRDPDPKVKNTERIFNIIGKDKSKRGSSLMLRNAGGSTAGVHPHIVIIDDPMDKEDRESPSVRKKKNRWYDTLIPLMIEFQHERGPIKKLIFIATRWHLADLVSHVLARDKKKKNDARKYDVESEGVLNPDKTLMYPEFFPQSKIDAVKEDIDEIFFACQYLNDPLPEGLLIFNEKRMHFRRLEQASIVLESGRWKFKGRNWCFFDPSLGKEKSDYPAVVWPNVQDLDIFFFDAIDQKIELAKLVPLIAAKNKLYRVTEMVFETNGSSLLKETLEKAHRDIKHPIVITEMNHTTNKHERITAMQPHLYNGTVFFRSDWEQTHAEMRSQIVHYPAEARDDFPDVVEMSIDHIRNNTFEFEKIGPDGDGQKQADQVSAVAEAFAMLKKT